MCVTHCDVSLKMSEGVTKNLFLNLHIPSIESCMSKSDSFMKGMLLKSLLDTHETILKKDFFDHISYQILHLSCSSPFSFSFSL